MTRRDFSLILGAALQAQDKADDLASLSLSEASRRLSAKQVSSVELTQACLERIETYNPKVNAFITVLKTQALERAKAMDAEIKSGKRRGPLHGIPLALKDNIDTAGVRTTAGSAVFDDRIPTEDATVVKKLNDAGAVCVGKLNLHEFAFGGTSVTSYFGPVRNPWDLSRHPGGSSGGSAAAVAAGLCFGALGTDTGGSIRTPASYCSIVGLKPTYGLVSIRGIVPLVLSRDHCGPMTRTVADAALMLNAMAGYDNLDIASVEHAREDYAALLKQNTKTLRIGVPRAPYFDHLDADVAKAVEEAIAWLAKNTASVKEVHLPGTRGMGGGGEVNAYHEEFFNKASGLYQIPTRRSLEGGKDAKAAAYIQGMWKMQLLRRTIDESFREQGVDLVVLPTRRRTPRAVDVEIKRSEETKPRNPSLENTSDFNTYGIPAVSIPCGFTEGGLPVGLMIAGPRFQEGRVLAMGQAYESAHEWGKRRPPLRPDTPVPALKNLEESAQ
jgi:aspartyl-tRNA(Asn)/glutamyl-tRNA(Gln) amidotransferase subunit A